MNGDNGNSAGRARAFVAAAGVPFIAYVFTASPTSYWLDSGEFIAAAVRLDIAHPPGHPLSELYGKLASLLPLGSLCFRVAIGQALAAALACGFMCLAVSSTLWALGLRHPARRWPLSLAGAWIAAFTYGVWFQAVRAEVYALQALALSVVIERIAALEARWPEKTDATPLYTSAIALGLALTNHHLIALMVVPALLPSAARVALARGVRPVLIGSGLGLLALCTYVYLPLRAMAGPPANLGDPQTLQRFFWVISARVYAHDMGGESWQPMSERFGDMLVLLVDNFGPWLILAAPLGLYALLRGRTAYRLGVFWGLLWLTNCGMRIWLGPVRANPDILGYLWPGLASLGALVASFLAAVVVASEELGDRARRLAGFLAAASPALALVTAIPAAPHASLASFTAVDLFDDLRVRSLPPRAVVLASTPQSVFRHWEVEAVEQVRPDLTLAALPFLAYPGFGERLAKSSPELAPVVSEFLRLDRLELDPLLAPASRRSVLVELDTHLPPSAYGWLVPLGLYYRVVLSEQAKSQLGEAARVRARLDRELYSRLGRQARETETSRQLLWIHYLTALFYAGRGALELAREQFELAVHLYPRDAYLLGLRKALADHDPRKPLDPMPFLQLKVK